MIRAGILPALALALVAAPMAAPLAAQDSRLVEMVYDPNRVVRIEGRTKVQATIKFGENETIENVAVGDATAWQITPNKRANLLFVKPLQSSAATNMTVVTNKYTYLFDLVASPRSRPLYILTFTYPEEERAKAEAELAAAGSASPAELAAATDPYAVLDPSVLNWDWSNAGDSKLFPLRTFDDGDATFLEWAEGTPVPAILVKDYEGTEGPVNFTVRGNMVIVDGVPDEIILRSGEETAVLTHTGSTSASRAESDSRTPAQVALDKGR